MQQGPEWLSFMFEGAVIALAARSLLNLDVDAAWAACIGGFGRLLEPWLVHQTHPSVATQAWADMTMTGVIVLALLGVTQMLHTR
jgi:hypothetical protein